jgi:hypothetical protein
LEHGSDSCMFSDFTDKSILVDFYESLDLGLRSQLTESAFYMGKPDLPLKGSGSLTRCQEQVCKWRDNDASAARQRTLAVRQSRARAHLPPTDADPRQGAHAAEARQSSPARPRTGADGAQIMFAGHPVERLCTYQYSLISLIPGMPPRRALCKGKGALTGVAQGCCRRYRTAARRRSRRARRRCRGRASSGRLTGGA